MPKSKEKICVDSDSKPETIVEFDEFGLVKGYLCPKCGSKVKLDHTDDIGTRFFKCEKCKEFSTRLTSEARKSLEKTLEKAIYDDEEGHFNPVLFAKHLLKEFNFKTTRDNETLYMFNKDIGIYSDLGEVFIKEQMVTKLEEETRQRYFSDVIFFVKGSTYFDRKNNPLNKIAVENGILDVVTKELTPYTPELFITTGIPVSYDTKAKCPKILKFLEEIVAKEEIPVIQEMFGYCLYKAMPFHQALMLIGDGANGKSTLLELLKRMLGAENVSNATLQSLCYNRFATAQLYEKLANICADLPAAALKQTGTFKMLTGNDTIEAQEKFKKPFNFKNHAKLIFSTNKAPDSLDDTLAFYRRWILITFNNIFEGKNCNPKILEEIATPKNLSGLLNFALEGLERLLKNGGFSITYSMEERRARYIRNANSAKAFIEERLVYNPDEYILVSTLYENYVLFCRENKLASTAKRVLTINMQQYLPRAQKIQKRVNQKITWVWQNVGSVTGVTTTLLNHLRNNKQREEIVTQSNKDVTEREKESMDSGRLSKHVVTPVTPTTCPLCLLALPKDKKKLGEWDGKIAHKICVEDVEKGRRKR